MATVKRVRKQADEALKSKFTLITNVNGIKIRGLWLQGAAAILIEETPNKNHGVQPGTMDRRLRVFGPDSAWPIFQEFLQDGELKISDHERSPTTKIFTVNVWNRDNPKKPVKESFEVYAAVDTKPLDFFIYENVIKDSDHHGKVYNLLWRTLDYNTAFYQTTPGVPTLVWAGKEDHLWRRTAEYSAVKNVT